MLFYTQSLIWPATGSHYSLNFGSEKAGPKRIYILSIAVRPVVSGLKFSYYKTTKTNRTQHVTIIFNFIQILYLNQVILLLSRVMFFIATKLQKRNKNTKCHKLLSNQI